ncbi:hypothetical protein J689_1348 [Acinetobacter sp. 1179249]|nr:hypothetical protein [Acinetobacter sp. 1179249]EXR33753.1 hypothetical protein J689_1348 [Acinetobacter sp. 1179249]
MKEKVFSDWYYQTRDITARAGFDAAWQHQQAKVEELQTLYTQQGINMLKMQKRLEELELFLKRIHRYGLDAYNVSTCMSIRDELEQALKGEGQ